MNISTWLRSFMTGIPPTIQTLIGWLISWLPARFVPQLMLLQNLTGRLISWSPARLVPQLMLNTTSLSPLHLNLDGCHLPLPMAGPPFLTDVTVTSTHRDEPTAATSLRFLIRRLTQDERRQVQRRWNQRRTETLCRAIPTNGNFRSYVRESITEFLGDEPDD